MRFFINSLLLVLLFSCGGNSSAGTETEPVTPEAEASTPEEAVYTAARKTTAGMEYDFTSNSGTAVTLRAGHAPAAASFNPSARLLGDSPLGLGEQANPLLVGMTFVLEADAAGEIVSVSPKNSENAVEVTFEEITMYAGRTDHLFRTKAGGLFFVSTDNIDEAGFQFPDDFIDIDEDGDPVPNSKYTQQPILLQVNKAMEVFGFSVPE